MEILSEVKGRQEYLFEFYKDGLDLKNAEGDENYRRVVDRFETDSKESAMIITDNFIHLRYAYPVSSKGYSLLLFRLIYDDLITNFGYLYFEKMGECKCPEKGKYECSCIENYKLRYICLSPTFDSKAGEYRHRFIRSEMFDGIFQKYGNILNPLVQEVIEMLVEKKIEVEARIFEDEKIFKKIIDQYRLVPKTLAIIFAMDLFATLQSHTNETYKEIMKQLEKIIDKKILGNIKEEKSFRDYVPRGVNNPMIQETGQKIIPISIYTANNEGNINYSAWREIYAMQTACNLVLNFICPSFPLFNNYFYIHGLSGRVFENPAMLEKIRLSERAKKRVLPNLEKIIFIVDKEKLNAQIKTEPIEDVIRNAEIELVLNDEAICTTMEHVGPTLSTLGDLTIQGKDLPSWHIQFIEQFDYLSKVVFDVLYGAHCLQTKVGILHTDLHLNNITMNKLTSVIRKQKPGQPPEEKYIPTVMYIASTDGERHSYLFPYSGLHGFIVDFSDTIFSNQMREEITKRFNKEFCDMFYENQYHRFHRTICTKVSDEIISKKRKAKLKNIIICHFDQFYKIISYYDFYMIASSFERFFNLCGERVNKEGRKFVKDIATSARRHLSTYLEDITETKEDLIDKMDIPWAGDKLLPEFFEKNLFNNFDLKGHKVVNIYNYNAKFNYHCEDFERFPLWAKPDEIRRSIGKMKMEDFLLYGVHEFEDTICGSKFCEKIKPKRLIEKK